jgi:hypothetical protein
MLISTVMLRHFKVHCDKFNQLSVIIDFFNLYSSIKQCTNPSTQAAIKARLGISEGSSFRHNGFFIGYREVHRVMFK